MGLADLMRQKVKDSSVKHLRNKIEESASEGYLGYRHYGDLTQAELDWLKEEGFSYEKDTNSWTGQIEYVIGWG